MNGEALSLDNLAIKYYNLKGSFHHDYMVWYEKYFAPLRSGTVRILEIGVWGGASLKIWKDYFPGAMIYGIDILGRCKKLEEIRIRVFIGRQEDCVFLGRVCQQIGQKIDIIIDDGGHVFKEQAVSLGYLIRYLAPGGYYFIEDIHETKISAMNQLIREVASKDAKLTVLPVYKGAMGEYLVGLKRER